MIEKIELTGATGSGKSSILREIEFTYRARIILKHLEQLKGCEEKWKIMQKKEA